MERRVLTTDDLFSEKRIFSDGHVIVISEINYIKGKENNPNIEARSMSRPERYYFVDFIRWIRMPIYSSNLQKQTP